MTGILKVDQWKDSGDNALITSDGSGALTFNASSITGVATTNGITEADQWRLTTTFTGNADPIINLERNDTTGFNYIGTGMTESSGTFTFPSTGYYLILADFSAQNLFADSAYNFFLKITTNNSTYTKGADAYVNPHNNGSQTIGRSIQFLFDVTDTNSRKNI